MKNIKYGDIPFSDRQIESMMNVFGDPGDDEGTSPSTAMLGQVIMTREGRRAARRRKKKGL